jgi:hypothetical protein
MAFIQISPAATLQDLIISTQGLVSLHPQFSGWDLSSDLSKQTLTLRHAHDSKALCTAKVSGPKIEIDASPSAAGILDSLIGYLIEIDLAIPVIDSAPHVPVEATGAMSKEQTRFASNLDAVKAAASGFPELLIIHDKALKVAAASDFEDPDFTYQALMALAEMVLRERSVGLNDTRQGYLAKKGFTYIPGSTACTLGKYGKDYTVIHEGQSVVLAGHISKGVKARRLLRIYFAWLPESKKFLIGHVGEHLPTETNPH